MTDGDLDRWTNTALAPGHDAEPRLMDLRSERLGKNVRVRPETKAELNALGKRINVGAAGIAGRILEELACQGILFQTYRAAVNRRRKAIYRLKYPQGEKANNPCGCGADCQDRDDCRFLFRGEKR